MLIILQSALQIAIITFTVTQQIDDNTKKGRLKASGKRILFILQ